VYIFTHIYIYVWFSFSILLYVCTKLLAQTNHWYKHVCVCVCVCVFCAWVFECYTVCVCVCVNHISIINHESSNSSWWLSVISDSHNKSESKQTQTPCVVVHSLYLGYITPTINYISGLRLCNLTEITCFRDNPIPFPSSGNSNKSEKLKDSQKYHPRTYLMVVWWWYMCVLI